MLKSVMSLKYLLYPEICLSCRELGFFICSSCQSIWLVKPRKTKISGINHYFTQTYNEQTARIILASKESGNQLAINLMASSIVRSLVFAISDINFLGRIDLVYIPSQKKIIRSRGRNHIEILLTQVVKELFKLEIIAHILPILELTKKARDQSTLNSKQREINMNNAFIVHNLQIAPDGIFLIDDLITTGASLREGIRAINKAKITVNGLVTACAVEHNFLIP